MNNNLVPIYIENYTSYSNDLVESIKINALFKKDRRKGWFASAIMFFMLISLAVIVPMCWRGNCRSDNNYVLLSPYVGYFAFRAIWFYTHHRRKQTLIKIFKEIRLPPQLKTSSGLEKLFFSQLKYVIKYNHSYLFYCYNKNNNVYLNDYRVYQLKAKEINPQQLDVLSRHFRFHHILIADN